MTSRDDQIAIENAAIVLAEIAKLAAVNPDFARHLSNIPVPGGRPIFHFANAIGATSARHPTEWRRARRRDAEAA
jgi:hypothetical protein